MSVEGHGLQNGGGEILGELLVHHREKLVGVGVVIHRIHHGVAAGGLHNEAEGAHRGISPDFTRKDVWKLAMDSVIEGVIKLKHNGVYFDGAYRCMDGFDHTGKQLSKVHDFDALNRELSAYVNQRLRTAKKDIYFWVNAGETGSFRNILSNPASGTLWELNNFHQIENNTLNVWNTVKETAVNMRNELWHHLRPIIIEVS